MLSRVRAHRTTAAVPTARPRRSKGARARLAVLVSGVLATGALAAGVLPETATDVPTGPVPAPAAAAPVAAPPVVPTSQHPEDPTGAGTHVGSGSGPQHVAVTQAHHDEDRAGDQGPGAVGAGAAAPVTPPSTGSPTPTAPTGTAGTAVGASPSPASAPAPTTSAPAPTAAAAPAPGVVVGTLGRVWAEELAPELHAPHAHDEVAAGHDAADHPARLSTYLVTDGPAYPVDGEAMSDVAVGATVTAELGAPAAAGDAHPVLARLAVVPPVLPADALAYGEGSRDLFGLAAASVVHDVTVVLATPKGATRDSMTVDSVRAAVEGGASSFWNAQSRSQRGFAVSRAFGWQTLTSTCDKPYALWHEVAARVGFTAGPRKHLLVYIPPSAGCGAGLGTVGEGPDSGGLSWVGYASTSIVAHELGHNMGLGHSNGLLCTSSQDGRYTSGLWQPGCSEHRYRDYYDVMGISWANLGSLAAPQADALGVLRSTEKLQTAASVRVQLVPQTSDGLRVLRVDDPAGPYFVEYRVATGWDAWLSNNYRGLDAGVLVHRHHPGEAREVLLLDGSLTTGTRTDDWRAALAPGTSLTTASGSTRIVVEKQTTGAATIAVHRDGVAPSDVEPPAGTAQVEILSPAPTGTAGTVVFSGVGTAPEGTLRWELRQDGVVRSTGSTATGVNGSFDTFHIPVALPAGTFTMRVWVSDDSDGETTADPTLLLDETTITLT